MENYELTLVLPGSATNAKKKKIEGYVKKSVELNKGKIKSTEDWGKKELAYKIKKNDSGIFLFFILELASEAAKAISEKLRMEEEIIRYLLVKQD